MCGIKSAFGTKGIPDGVHALAAGPFMHGDSWLSLKATRGRPTANGSGRISGLTARSYTAAYRETTISRSKVTKDRRGLIYFLYQCH